LELAAEDPQSDVVDDGSVEAVTRVRTAFDHTITLYLDKSLSTVLVSPLFEHHLSTKGG
jgi:hypothetical protein